MANIKLNLTANPFTGQIVTFVAPCDCDQVADGLLINGEVYTVYDAAGKCVTGVAKAWVEGAIISVALDCEHKKAFIQATPVPEVPEITIADVVGLQSALDGKSATGHTHTPSDITGLQDALNTNATAIQNHTNNKSNPHGVTAEQIGAISAEIHLWKASVPDVCGHTLDTTLQTFTFTSTCGFKYASAVISDGATVSLKNPSSLTVASTTYSQASKLAGKFVTASSSYDEAWTGIIYVPSGGVTTTSSKRTITGYYVSPAYTPGEDLGTVTSTDPNAYPQNASKDGVYYEYLGKLGDILVNYGARICTGSYEGTGTYGEDNPMSIVFPFVPKFVMIGSYHGNEAMFNLTKLRDGAYVPYAYHAMAVSNTMGQLTLDDAQYATINGKTLSFYATTSAGSQVNILGGHYEWFAIG